MINTWRKLLSAIKMDIFWGKVILLLLGMAQRDYLCISSLLLLKKASKGKVKKGGRTNQPGQFKTKRKNTRIYNYKTWLTNRVDLSFITMFLKKKQAKERWKKVKRLTSRVDPKQKDTWIYNYKTRLTNRIDPSFITMLSMDDI